MLTGPSKPSNPLIPVSAARPATAPAVPPAPGRAVEVRDGWKDARPASAGRVHLGGSGGTPLTGQHQKSIHITVFADKKNVKTVLAVAGASTALKAAIQTQRELSDHRVLLGSHQLGRSPASPADITGVKADIARLERTERTQAPSDVETARYVVFHERLGQLEKSLGRKEAVQLARQTYVNGESWARLSGAPRASEAQLSFAGLPRGVPLKGEAGGGFSGEMRTLHGERVDMGRVMCALDCQVNAARVPRKVSVKGLSLYNPLDVQGATLGSDVGAVISRLPAGLSRAEINSASATALLQRGEAKLRGDVDGLNIARRLQKDPPTGLSQLIEGYYSSGASARRMEELAGHGKYILRDAQGQALLDGTGHYRIDAAALGSDGWWAAFAMAQENPAIPLEQADAAALAFHDWMKKEQDSARV